MFQGLNPRTFLNTCQEWHALVVGFCEVACPWPPRHKPSQDNEKDIADEYHYYMWGRVLGILAWITTACVIISLLR